EEAEEKNVNTQNKINEDMGTNAEESVQITSEELKKSSQNPDESEQKDKTDIYTSQHQEKEDLINVRPVSFQPLEQMESKPSDKNIQMIMDVPLQVSVELGRTKKLIKEILELNIGSVIELDKMAGEPVDILVNGKLVAKGEVVVIEDNFGVRITDIITKDI
ncbi:MAG TPA: flagellar motor switch protein FliN, partial [Clostridiales bacterium]|nr:flagellar motor switch protein FliN [Clostridiales bacterium]